METFEEQPVPELAEVLAENKVMLKKLEEEIKAIQEELIARGVACDLKTTHGKLVYSTRTNYDLVDKHGIIKHLGQKVYNAHSTISKTGIEKAVGELGFQQVLDSGFMSVKSISEYFMLKK